MTVPATHCEVKKHSYRQTQDGIVISFVIHPSDVPDRLTLAPLGTRFMLALAEIGDDEKPVSAPPGKRTAWNDMPVPQRAALLCKEAQFQDFCARLAGIDEIYWHNASAEQRELRAADFLRAECGVDSRAQLTLTAPSGKTYLAIETEYFAAIGKIADPR